MMEKVYKTMRNSGAISITIGILLIVVGLVTGILAIVSGGNLLARKNDITF